MGDLYGKGGDLYGKGDVDDGYTFVMPGAFRTQVGKIVPVTNEAGDTVGHAEVVDADGGLRILMNPNPQPEVEG